MNRRTFLRSALVGGGGIGLAGCLGSGGNPIQIAYIDIVNSGDQQRSLVVEVLFDGDSVVDETYVLSGGERADRIESELPDEAGKYEITVNPAEVPAETFVPGSQTEAECGWLEYEILGPERLVQHFDNEC